MFYIIFIYIIYIYIIIYPYLRLFYRCFQDSVHPPGVWHRAIEGVQGSNDAPWSGRSVRLMTNYDWFVVWTPLKNMKVSWDDYSRYMEK